MATFDSYQQGTPCYVELTTPDVPAAGAFYSGLFGWTLTDISSGNVPDRYLSCAVEGAKVAGLSCPVPDEADEPAHWTVFLAVDDVDATVAGVPAAGGQVTDGPMTVRDLGRMALVRDPAGARFNLWEARSDIGTQRANEPGTPIWHELVTPDLATATGFYAEILGVTWESSPEVFEAGRRTQPTLLVSYEAMLVDGRAVAGAQPPPQDEPSPRWAVYFHVSEVEESLARAESLGGRILVPAFDVPNVGLLAMLADPQGGVFWLMGPAAEAA